MWGSPCPNPVCSSLSLDCLKHASLHSAPPPPPSCSTAGRKCIFKHLHVYFFSSSIAPLINVQPVWKHSTWARPESESRHPVRTHGGLKAARCPEEQQPSSSRSPAVLHASAPELPAGGNSRDTGVVSLCSLSHQSLRAEGRIRQREDLLKQPFAD